MIAIIAILAGLLLPALARAKGQAHQANCTSNLRQLGLCWQMYSHDHERLPESYYFDPSQGINEYAWIRGSMDDNSAFGRVDPGVLDSTNRNTITLGKLFPYNQSVDLYRCPSDQSRTHGVPRVRSYSMNSWMGGRPLAGQNQFRVFLRQSQIVAPPPSDAFVFIDEHEASIKDGWFPVDMVGNRGLLAAPAGRHSAGFTLAFADGSARHWKIQDSRTLNWTRLPISNNPFNPDWDRLRQSASSLR